MGDFCETCRISTLNRSDSGQKEEMKTGEEDRSTEGGEKERSASGREGKVDPESILSVCGSVGPHF